MIYSFFLSYMETKDLVFVAGGTWKNVKRMNSVLFCQLFLHKYIAFVAFVDRVFRRHSWT